VLSASGAEAAKGSLAVQGTEFILRLEDGRTLRGADLAGAGFVLRQTSGDVAIRIEGVEHEDTVGGLVHLYRLSLHGPDGLGRPLCLPDAKGRRLALPVEGAAGGFSLTCTSGAEGKCILMGYRPWDRRADGAPMRDLHRACIHLIRADYGGDGNPTTRDGTAIDLYDRYGIQSPIDFSMAFEAAWGVDGAVCVARPRIPDAVSLSEIADRYPRLRAALGPARCSEADAAALPGALLFNRSHEGPGAPTP
jgi:hypothetical protein